MDLMLELNQRQEMVQGEYGDKAQLSYELVDNDNIPVNITGYVTAKFYAINATDELVKYSGNLVVDDAVLGLVHYSPLITDFTTPGKYDIELFVNFAASRMKWANIILTVYKSRGT